MSFQPKYRRRGAQVSKKKHGYYQASRSAYARSAPLARFTRSIAPKMHMFKQLYRPSSTAMAIGGAGTGTSYDPNEGILFGPDPASTAGDGFFALKFLLSDLPQQSSFGGLFDAYRINKVVVIFTPMLGPYTGINGVATGTAGTFDQALYTVIDRDDHNVLTALSQAEEYETLKMTAAARKHKRVLTPAVAMEVYKAGGLSNGYSQRYKQWIDMGTNDVDHYGLKGVIQGASTNTHTRRASWYVRVKMYFSCKQVR